MTYITPDVNSAILDLMDGFKTLGAYRDPDQEPPFRVALRALEAAILAYGDARAAEERDKIIQRIKAEATKPEHGDGHVYALLDELADAIRANADQPGA